MRIVGFLKKQCIALGADLRRFSGRDHEQKKRREITEIMIVSTGSESVD